MPRTNYTTQMQTKLVGIQAATQRLLYELKYTAWDTPGVHETTSVRIQIIRGDTVVWSQERRSWLHTTKWMKPMVPDCRTCGVCCVVPNEQDYWVDVDARDIKRLGKAYTQRNVVNANEIDTKRFGSAYRLQDAVWSTGIVVGCPAIRTRWKTQRAGPFQGASVCACCSLRGSILHRTSCAIYNRRPQSCRILRPGSRVCLEQRQVFLDAAAMVVNTQ